MSCGIYKITNKTNGKVYIGKSCNIERRWREHKSDTFNPNKPDRQEFPLYRAFHKYGIDNFSFEIIEENPSDINGEREKYWIEHYDSNNSQKGYNATLGGDTEIKYNRNQIQDMWEQGKSKKEIIDLTGAAPCTITEIFKELGIYDKDEIKKRETNRKSNSVKAYDFNGNFIKEYPSCREAARELGRPDAGSTIGACCKGKRKSAFGFQWRYTSDMPPGIYGGKA